MNDLSAQEGNPLEKLIDKIADDQSILFAEWLGENNFYYKGNRLWESNSYCGIFTTNELLKMFHNPFHEPQYIKTKK